jgi:hypothetical protein
MISEQLRKLQFMFPRDKDKYSLIWLMDNSRHRAFLNNADQ